MFTFFFQEEGRWEAWDEGTQRFWVRAEDRPETGSLQEQCLQEQAEEWQEELAGPPEDQLEQDLQEHEAMVSARRPPGKRLPRPEDLDPGR